MIEKWMLKFWIECYSDGVQNALDLIDKKMEACLPETKESLKHIKSELLKSKYKEDFYDLPSKSRHLISSVNYRYLVSPFVKEDLLKGKSVKYCENKYNLTKDEVRYIGKKIYVYN